MSDPFDHVLTPEEAEEEYVMALENEHAAEEAQRAQEDLEIGSSTIPKWMSVQRSMTLVAFSCVL